MKCFKCRHLILILRLFDIIFGFTYTSSDGVEIVYNIQFKRECRGETDILIMIHNIPLTECAMACGMRQQCKYLSYMKRFNMCRLYSSIDDMGGRIKQSCVEIRAADIVVKKKPCPVCAEDKTCNQVTGKCETTECLNYNYMTNGRLEGNLRSVGSSVQYICDNGDMLFNSLECLQNGLWNITEDKCTIKMTNIATGKQTNMSSIFEDNNGEKGVDGNINQLWSNGSCFHTEKQDNPWWKVDLEKVYHIYRVVLYNRLDVCCAAKASDLDIMFGTTTDKMVIVGHVDGQIDNIHTFKFRSGKEARYVQVMLTGHNPLHLCEVEVFGF